MGEARYSKLKKVLQSLLDQGYNQVGLNTLRRQIVMEIGGDEYRTIKPCLNQMLLTGLIKDVGNGFEIVLSELVDKDLEQAAFDLEESKKIVEGGEQ